jgi:hypothetical protein
VCTARPLRDDKSGLDLPAGTTVLDGGRALEYVRSRYLDATADLGRMQRQQRFVAEFIHRATGSGVLLNPVRLSQTIGSALASVRADKGLTPTDLINLAGAVRNFSPASAEFTSVPIKPYAFRVPGLGQTVRWEKDRAARLFEALREDRPLAASKQQPAPAGSAAPNPGGENAPARPASPPKVPVPVAPPAVHVEVLGGPTAQRVADGLRGTGFTVLPLRPPATTQPGARTVISYDPGWDRSAHSLAAALPGAELRPAWGLGPVLRVTPGTAFTGVTPVRGDTPAPKVNPATGVGAVTGDQVVCP